MQVDVEVRGWGRGGWVAVLTVLLMVGLAGPAQALSDRLQRQVDAGNLGDIDVAFMVKDLSSGQVLASENPDASMIPASNMKIVTTAAAFDVLGEDGTFRTTLARTAEPDGTPSLVVIGQGDPAFGDDVLLQQHDPPLNVELLLEQWVGRVVATGQTEFAALYIDDRVFDRMFVHASWPADQLLRWYAAEVAGINFHRNVLEVMPTPGATPGASPGVTLYPASPFLATSNRATTGDRQTFWIHRPPDSNDLTYRGMVEHRPFGPAEVTLHDPPGYFGQLFEHQLAERGIAVGRIHRLSDEDELDKIEPLHIVQTSLGLIAARVNQDSQNMYAEALLKRLGHEATRQPGSWENGAAAIRMALRRRVGTDSANMSISDGSGLSRGNRVTARLLVEILDAMHQDPELAGPFRRSLAEAGVSGTLSSRMRNLDGRVYAKTGYIRQVSALSGYLVLEDAEAAEGERVIAFSLLFNGFQPPVYNRNVRDVQDAMVQAIEEFVASRLAVNQTP